MNIDTLPITMQLVDQFVGYNQLRNKSSNIYPTSSSNGTFVVLGGTLSGPRAKRAGPVTGRAVTGRQCPHSGKGEDFLTGQPDFFTETAVTPEQKVEKSFPRWEINHHAKG